MPLDATYQRLYAEASAPRSLWSDPAFLAGFGESRGAWHVQYVGPAGSPQLALPYFARATPLGAVVTLPPLLRYVEPLFVGEPTPSVRARLLEAAIEALSARHGLSTFSFTPETSALLPEDLSGLQWRPTYRVPLGEGVNTARLANKTMRRRLRRAREHWRLTTGPLTESVLEVLEAAFARQGIGVPYDRTVLAAHFAQLHASGQAVSHQCLDERGAVQAASVVIADERAAYCWVSGSTDAARAHDGGSLVLAADVAWAQATGRRWADFLGSALPGPAENRRQLGGERSRYAYVQRDRAWWAKLRRRWRQRR